jgi:hypothetical protein
VLDAEKYLQIWRKAVEKVCDQSGRYFADDIVLALLDDEGGYLDAEIRAQ